MDRVMKSFPKMFRVFITKQVSHFCATNRMLSLIDGKTKNQCPSCGCPNENTTHITRCLDPGRSITFIKNVNSIKDWLTTQKTGPQITSCITQYLLAGGRTSMTAITRNMPALQSLANHHDRLGWDSFLEGRICCKWVKLRHQEIEATNLRTTADFWACGLMSRLLQLTHAQWTYCNHTVHFKHEGLASTQHDTIISRMKDLWDTDPEALLPEHRALLEYDFEEMGEASPSEHQFWIAEMEAATSAADHVRTGAEQSIRSRHTNDNSRSIRSPLVVAVNDEGTVQWRRDEWRHFNNYSWSSLTLTKSPSQEEAWKNDMLPWPRWCCSTSVEKKDKNNALHDNMVLCNLLGTICDLHKYVSCVCMLDPKSALCLSIFFHPWYRIYI